MTSSLSELILQQEQDFSLYSTEAVNAVVQDLKKKKDDFLSNKFENIMNLLGENKTLQRCLKLNREKGVGSWLTVLPLKDQGYCLNKQEFKDAICLRYGWKVPNTPQFCGCGALNDVNHTLICAKGGYVSMRHNALRDLNADLQKEVCRDVVTEPRLLPLDNNTEVDATDGDRAAPDVSSRGLWSTFERTFFDVCVFHPNAPSYQSISSSALYQRHEKEKMKKYNARILTVEKGTFTPLVYTTFGGCGPQATAYHKRLAQLIAKKQNQEYRQVISHIRTRIRFSLLRSVLVAMRGESGKRKQDSLPISSVDFNLIPDALHYECS